MIGNTHNLYQYVCVTSILFETIVPPIETEVTEVILQIHNIKQVCS